MIKIALIEPPVDAQIQEGTRTYEYLPPLWAVALGTFLKKRIPKLKIWILDGRLIGEGGIKSAIKKDIPDLVGLSPKFPNYRSTIEIARFTKKFHSKVLLGGAHSTHLCKEILLNRGPFSDDYCIDGIIREDGEEALYKYINGREPAKIENFVWQDASGKTRENPIKLPDLNDLPASDFSLVNLSDYFRKKRMLPIYSQKGCRWRIESGGGCLFCGQTDLSLRLRSAEKVWQEISDLKRRYNIEAVWDSSEDFLNDLGWFSEFHRLSFKYPQKPKLKIFVRIARINSKITQMFKDLNITEMLLGIESGSQKSLAAMRKGSNVVQNKKAVQNLHRVGIQTFFCFVLGAPGESPKTVRESIRLAKNLTKLPLTTGIRFNSLTPFPGSLAWQMLLKKTGHKYQGQDLIDWREVCSDWVDGFCQFSTGEYPRLLNEARASVRRN